MPAIEYNHLVVCEANAGNLMVQAVSLERYCNVSFFLEYRTEWGNCVYLVKYPKWLALTAVRGKCYAWLRENGR